jgi:hypothetical protein
LRNSDKTAEHCIYLLVAMLQTLVTAAALVSCGMLVFCGMNDS